MPEWFLLFLCIPFKQFDKSIFCNCFFIENYIEQIYWKTPGLEKFNSFLAFINPGNA